MRSNNSHSELSYKRLERGDAVTIRYREVYRVTKAERNLVDLDFLDATKRAD